MWKWKHRSNAGRQPDTRGAGHDSNRLPGAVYAFSKISLFIIIVIIMQQNLLAIYQVEIRNLSYYY